MNKTREYAVPAARQRRRKDPRFLAPRIYALAMVLRRATNLHTKREIGLPQESARIMTLLGEFQPMRLNDLAERSALDRGQLSRGVTALEKQGLVSRKRHGRAVLHELTVEGERYFAQLLESAEVRNEFLLRDIPEEQRRQFFGILDTIMERANELHEAEKLSSQPDGG